MNSVISGASVAEHDLRRYLYTFGFEEPDMFAFNRSHEDRDEDLRSAESLWIMAASEDDAREWGNRLAEGFVEHLYRDSDHPWRDAFDPGVIEDPQSYQGVPPTLTVRHGETTDFEAWVARRERELRASVAEYRRGRALPGSGGSTPWYPSPRFIRGLMTAPFILLFLYLATLTIGWLNAE